MSTSLESMAVRRCTGASLHLAALIRLRPHSHPPPPSLPLLRQRGAGRSAVRRGSAACSGCSAGGEGLVAVDCAHAGRGQGTGQGGERAAGRRRRPQRGASERLGAAALCGEGGLRRRCGSLAGRRSGHVRKAGRQVDGASPAAHSPPRLAALGGRKHQETRLGSGRSGSGRGPRVLCAGGGFVHGRGGEGGMRGGAGTQRDAAERQRGCFAWRGEVWGVERTCGLRTACVQAHTQGGHKSCANEKTCATDRPECDGPKCVRLCRRICCNLSTGLKLQREHAARFYNCNAALP